MHTQKHNAGFTLVELAIVLVIIGLLVGGVLVGQDLIKAAEIRSTIKQLEDTNSAVNTFRTKFGGFPGDLLNTRAASFGFVTRAGTNGSGDADGQIEGTGGGTAGNLVLGSENVLFWRDLSTASLIPEAFSTATDAAAASITSGAMPAYLPNTKLRETTFIHTTVSNGRNFYFLGSMSSGALGAITAGDGVTPLESKSIDEKTDDGAPTTGTTVAVTALAATTLGYTADAGAAAATGVCVNTGVTPTDYNVIPAYQTEINCGLIVRASF